MKTPVFEGNNVAAMVGAVVGSIGGLFVFDVVRAIALWPNFRLMPQLGEQNPAGTYPTLFQTPKLSLICCVVCLPLGWFIGSWIGSWFNDRFRTQRAEMAGGAIGGLVPVILAALWGWYQVNGP